MGIRLGVCGVVQVADEGSCFQIERGDGAEAGVFGDESITKSIVNLDIVELELRVVLRCRVNVSANWLGSTDVERDDLWGSCYRERAVIFRSAQSFQGKP